MNSLPFFLVFIQPVFLILLSHSRHKWLSYDLAGSPLQTFSSLQSYVLLDEGYYAFCFPSSVYPSVLFSCTVSILTLLIGCLPLFSSSLSFWGFCFPLLRWDSFQGVLDKSS